MVFVLRYGFELHDNLYFATREIGRLYETEPILHNYALCYALGLVDSDRHGTRVPEARGYRYFSAEQVPDYAVHLEALNRAGIYLTPARALQHTTVLNTWKYGDNRYRVEMGKTQKNIPSFGRAKEVAPGSTFEFFVIAPKPLELPRWIRLGKWLSKAELTLVDARQLEPTRTETEFVCAVPLNPLDVMFSHSVLSYDTVNMPPVSLIRHVRLRGSSLDYGEVKLPGRMRFHFAAPT
jgi:CRISPR-associated protein Csc1